MNYIPHIETYGKPFKNYAVVLEQGAADQMSYVLRQDWVLQGALMADAHQGYTMPIGGVVKTLNMVSPVFVGYDIGCGVCAQLTTFNKDEVFELRYKLKEKLYNNIPVGQNHNKRPQAWAEYQNIPKTDWFAKMFIDDEGFKQLGTMGGNNHFIEIDYDEQDRIWITVHSGSRHIGHTVGSYYIRLAHPQGKLVEGAYALDVNTQVGKDYILDLNISLAFALENRRQMVSAAIATINQFIKGEAAEGFINRNHNHAESKDGIHWIHRKGATHAEEGMLGIVPGNMRDGSFIVRGKGNQDSLFSSSHGAGRICSRKKAKNLFTVEEVETTMGDVAVNINEGMLDESPGSYKNIFEVMEQQKDLVEIVHHIKPIICIKG